MFPILERLSFNRARKYKPLKVYSKKISVHPILCSSTYKNSTISALGDNNGNLFLVDTDTKNKMSDTEINVCDSSIFDLCWNYSSSLAIASGETDLLVLNIFKNSFDSYKGHKKTIRCIKKSENRLLTGSGDGRVFCWDLRDKMPVMELNLPKKSQKIISSLEIHSENNHLVFATSTPGTILNTWDIRYTRRGMYISKEENISNAITNYLFYHNNFLYSVFSDGSILRITETGIFMNYLSVNDSYNLTTGRIDFDQCKNFIIFGSGEKIVICDPDFPNEPNILSVGQINGITVVQKKHIMTYNDIGEVKIYEYFYGGINLIEN